MTKQKGFSVVIVLAILLVVALVGFAGWRILQKEPVKASNSDAPKQSSQISNFEECAAAGNPIMESYPEQCTANGKTYTKEIKQ